jgi:hypothetical protein
MERCSPLFCSKTAKAYFLGQAWKTRTSTGCSRVESSTTVIIAKAHIDDGMSLSNGEVQEWLNWLLSKSSEPQGSEGSNPSLSARKDELRSLGLGFSLLEENELPLPLLGAVRVVESFPAKYFFQLSARLIKFIGTL